MPGWHGEEEKEEEEEEEKKKVQYLISEKAGEKRGWRRIEPQTQGGGGGAERVSGMGLEVLLLLLLPSHPSVGTWRYSSSPSSPSSSSSSTALSPSLVPNRTPLDPSSRSAVAKY